jgi:hypothetical protein
MFNFCTSDGQAVDSSQTKICTSDGQALVSINKHIQTVTNKKKHNKQETLNFFNSHFSKNQNKPQADDQFLDNLKTPTDKNYNDPL